MKTLTLFQEKPATWVNFENSPFTDRCMAVHTSIQAFETNQKFDLIVSNPPYFEPNYSDGKDRSKARQQFALNFEELIEISDNLLNPKGNCAFIIPFNSENNFIQLASDYQLFPTNITRVKGNANVGIKRSLLLFSKEKSKPEMDELVIEHSRNVYTEDYIKLTKNFYLKM